MTAAFYTLGCKVNQYEIDAILHSLKGEYEVTEEFEKADIYIVNTCAVTSEAEKKSRQYVAKILNINKDAKIIICGCAAENNAEQFVSKPQVSLVVGTAQKGLLAEKIKNKLA